MPCTSQETQEFEGEGEEALENSRVRSWSFTPSLSSTWTARREQTGLQSLNLRRFRNWEFSCLCTLVVAFNNCLKSPKIDATHVLRFAILRCFANKVLSFLCLERLAFRLFRKAFPDNLFFLFLIFKKSILKWLTKCANFLFTLFMRKRSTLCKT